MSDWTAVNEAEPWVLPSAEAATVRQSVLPFRPTKQFASLFPRLTNLLSQARQLDVTLPSGLHQLFAWGDAKDGIRAWLSPVPPAVVPGKAAPDHQTLLGCFGGIAERFGEPTGNWLLNHDAALTASEVIRDASFLIDYAWAFDTLGGIPIDMTAYYPASWEANGNCILCERQSGQLLFFAPDHADRDLIPFGPCPMYTLHTKLGGSTLREWVERIAEQWLRTSP